ncbi:MAG: Pycsar system effector family protein [Flavitalea sp.]
MTEADQQLLIQVRQYVANLFDTRLDPAFVFHNYDHTKEVVRACELLSEFYQVTDEDRVPLLVAAWFHDTGYIAGKASGHELVSEKIAAEYLEGKVDPVFLSKVRRCIECTRVPQNPGSQIEMIMCDADLFHLGTDSFDERNKLLRKEINKLGDKKISKKDWHKVNIDFLRQHQYFTSYGKEKLEPIKQHFLAEISAKLHNDKPDEIVNITIPATKPAGKPFQQTSVPLAVTPDDKPSRSSNEVPGSISVDDLPVSKKGAAKLKEDPDKIKKDSKVERSISTMFRIISDNHVSLSQMADSKANIMISVNTIVISILVSVLLGKLQFYPEYILPTIILLSVCLSAVVFAILATRPNVSRGTFTREDISNKKANLLFFGNFYNMALEDYDWAMKEMMSDREYLNSSMIKDIYFLGVVLARKYKYLRISYNIFMFGLVVAIVAFGIAFFVGM